MEDTERPRDSAYTLMRHAVLTSPSANRLVTHLLVITTNVLTALALGVVMIAFTATFFMQCFSIVCIIEKFLECFGDVAISLGARVVSFLLMKTCFSNGNYGERERLAAGAALIRYSYTFKCASSYEGLFRSIEMQAFQYSSVYLSVDMYL